MRRKLDQDRLTLGWTLFHRLYFDGNPGEGAGSFADFFENLSAGHRTLGFFPHLNEKLANAIRCRVA